MSDKDRVWTVPNLLSVFRLLLLIPILLALQHEQRVWALFLMLLSVGTDFLDGYIARRWNQRSDFGRMIDPVVDKICVLTVVCFMVVHTAYSFPLWFFVFLLVREVGLMMCSLLVVRRKRVVMESNRPGKNSAFANGMVVLLFVLNLQPYGWIVLWIALALTLYSTWVYLRLFLKQIQDIRPNERVGKDG